MSAFAPDSQLVAEVVASPNHEERLGRGRPDMIVLHYTGMTSADAALERLTDRASKVSSHYLVFEDGRIFQLVAEDRRGFHAGVSCWENETDTNSRSIGIEIANPGHDYGYPDFPAVQIEAVTALCRDILARRPMRPHRVVAHSDVAPSRKNDPGEKFPWRHLSSAGVGLWVEPAPIGNDDGLAAGAGGPAVEALQIALSQYGYGAPANSRFDALTRDVVIAFQRHFRPSRVDGVADASTIETLRRLLDARDA